ncbi:MAG: Glutarate-semialdehyde dehydrogenase DavD [Alphaproteobacteria bacterium MarineAlpha5_Bin9]|nr:MAG: Glutarate-semialdehyde dehydrogenase DavD [Alphaproteobacteria bacterium MarineAlpha5_Bin9]|tara:strand:+ start:10404 stop:11855 length:1452 start_codon:yes stop_codon:yes gene_type:complete
MNISNKSLFKNKCFVNGEWINSANNSSIDVINPATLKSIGKVPDCGTKETHEAIKKAYESWKNWKEKTALERSILLKKWNDLILANQEDLAQIMTIEQGKPISESRAEIVYGASFVEWFAEECKRVYGDIIPDRFKDKRTVVIKQPIGVVGAITPWNFPSSMITRKCAPALAVGCPVIIKPAPQTPFSALALASLAEKAGFPKGVINILTGDAEKIGKELCSNSLVRKISFTGSTEVGKILLKQSAPTVKKVSLELGGHAPFIAFEDCDIDEAVTGAIQSKFRNTGQTCVCANRIFIHEKIYEIFIKKFTEEVSKIKVGNGLEENVTAGPLIDNLAVEKVKDHIQDAIKKGSKIAIGGKPHDLGGNFYEPTILYDVSIKAKITNEETFGPVAPIYKFSSEKEVIEMANNSEYGLASYFFSRDIGRIWRVSEALEYGIVGVNTGLPSKAEIPFGGMKQSGLGREGSKYGLEDFLEIKYINMAGI